MDGTFPNKTRSQHIQQSQLASSAPDKMNDKKKRDPRAWIS